MPFKCILSSHEQIEFFFYRMETLQKEKLFSFGLVDYLVFGAMLLVSTLIGFYHGCSIFSRKSKVPETNVAGNFLTANGQLSTIPVALSMLAR